MEALWTLSLRALGHVTAILAAKNWYLPISIKKDLWFLNTISTTFLLVMLFYPNLDTFFVVVFFFFLSFFFLSSRANYF